MIETATLEVPQEEARGLYAKWLAHCRGEHTRQEAAIKDAYRELARGVKLIDLKRTIVNAGVDEQSRPKLAAIRADAKRCCYHNYSFPAFYLPSKSHWDRETSRVKSVVRLPRGSLPECTKPLRGGGVMHRHLEAIVPLVPPHLRPAGNLSRYVILWEADWEDAPVDPLLLRPLGGEIYKVVAAWDLTPVEQAALRGDLD